MRLDTEQFSSAFLGRLYQLVMERIDQGHDPDPASCMMHLEPAETRLLTDILSRQSGLREDKEQLAEYIRTIQYQYQKRNAPADDAALLQEAIRRKQG